MTTEEKMLLWFVCASLAMVLCAWATYLILAPA